jgi:hypothetical protein
MTIKKRILGCRLSTWIYIHKKLRMYIRLNSCTILFIFGVQEFILYSSVSGEYEHFFLYFFGATAPILALAYLHETFRFTSVY